MRESAYDLMYHTYVLEGEAGLEDMREREIKRLRFLRRKLLEDLEAGEKIWVWKSAATLDADQVQPLLNALRTLGPNTLLWVVEGDERHRPGTIQRLDRDLIKGYIERFAPYDNAPDIRPASWFEVCQRTYDLCYPAPPEPLAVPAVQAQPVRSAMEFLARKPANVLTNPRPGAAMTKQEPPSWLQRLFRRR